MTTYTLYINKTKQNKNKNEPRWDLPLAVAKRSAQTPLSPSFLSKNGGPLCGVQVTSEAPLHPGQKPSEGRDATQKTHRNERRCCARGTAGQR